MPKQVKAKPKIAWRMPEGPPEHLPRGFSDRMVPSMGTAAEAPAEEKGRGRRKKTGC